MIKIGAGDTGSSSVHESSLLLAQPGVLRLDPSTPHSRAPPTFNRTHSHIARQFLIALFFASAMTASKAGFGSQLPPHNVWADLAYWPFFFFDSPLALNISAVVGLGCFAVACYIMARCFGECGEGRKRKSTVECQHDPEVLAF